MLSEEKAKRRAKPQDKRLLGAILLSLIFCAVSTFFFLRHSSDVPLLDGLSSGEEAEAAILERLPLGSSRAEVESFIAEQLQPSETCTSLNEDETICLMAFGGAGLCGFMVWGFEFRFENEVLSKLNVNYGAGCM